MTRDLIDTNVFSKIFGNNLAVKVYVENLECAVDATVFIECLQGSKSNDEKRLVKRYLENFPLLLISPEISICAIDLIDRYSNSYGLFLPDALIAATAFENDLTLVTYNLKDFGFIDGLRCLKP